MDPVRKILYIKKDRTSKNLTRNKVEVVLDELGKTPHYLLGKPVSKWDRTDKCNWNNIIRRDHKHKHLMIRGVND